MAILVAGGFHTPGMTQLLKDRGVAYVVIAPTVESHMDEALYHSLLLNQVPSVEELIRELSKDVAAGTLRSSSHQGKALIQSQGITSIDDQLQVHRNQPVMGRTDQAQPSSQSKRRYLQEAWTALKIWLALKKGWLAQEIQILYRAMHPSLSQALRFTVTPHGQHQIAVTVNGVTYESEGGSVKVVSATQPSPQQEAILNTGAIGKAEPVPISLAVFLSTTIPSGNPQEGSPLELLGGLFATPNTDSITDPAYARGLGPDGAPLIPGSISIVVEGIGHDAAPDHPLIHQLVDRLTAAMMARVDVRQLHVYRYQNGRYRRGQWVGPLGAFDPTNPLRLKADDLSS